ncbi:unnamed protein product [Prunus brigantina]
MQQKNDRAAKEGNTKMPENDKPLATLELTRTQKRRVQRQYCTFLKNRDDSQMEYDGELDEEIEAFSAELESLLQGDLGINMVFILPEKFRAAKGQESTLEGDVLSQEKDFPRKRRSCNKSEKGIPENETTQVENESQEMCFWSSSRKFLRFLVPMNPVVKTWLFRGWAIDLIGKIYPANSKQHCFIIYQAESEQKEGQNTVILTTMMGGFRGLVTSAKIPIVRKTRQDRIDRVKMRIGNYHKTGNSSSYLHFRFWSSNRKLCLLYNL